jgi:hypothetical protein
MQIPHFSWPRFAKGRLDHAAVPGTRAPHAATLYAQLSARDTGLGAPRGGLLRHTTAHWQRQRIVWIPSLSSPSLHYLHVRNSHAHVLHSLDHIYRLSVSTRSTLRQLHDILRVTTFQKHSKMGTCTQSEAPAASKCNCQVLVTTFITSRHDTKRIESLSRCSLKG